jgi:hypothetical protein
MYQRKPPTAARARNSNSSRAIGGGLVAASSVGRLGICQLPGELGRRALRPWTALIGVVIIDVTEHVRGVSNPVLVGQGSHGKVIPYLVAPDDQVSLDPRRLVWRDGAMDRACVIARGRPRIR